MLPSTFLKMFQKKFFQNKKRYQFITLYIFICKPFTIFIAKEGTESDVTMMDVTEADNGTQTELSIWKHYLGQTA